MISQLIQTKIKKYSKEVYVYNLKKKEAGLLVIIKLKFILNKKIMYMKNH